MGVAENDHVGWLKKQGQALRQATLGEVDEKKRLGFAAKSERMFRAAEALEMALQGMESGAMGGHLGLQRRLVRGTRVVVRLVGDLVEEGVISAMGRYDFALRRESDGLELVVPKHAVVYWVLVGGEVVEEGDGE